MEKFLNPATVVLFGVPRTSGQGTFNNLETMVRYGYLGKIHVVHPKADEILEYKTFQSVLDIPETPDLAVISVGRDNIMSVIHECGEKGVKRAIIISQGFADADDEGARIQNVLLQIAENFGMRIIGPNTLGVLNAYSGVNTGFVNIPRDTDPSPLSVIVQSGVFMVSADYFTMSVGKAIDIGNGGDVDFVDALEYFENDPQTKIIALHMEGLKRGRQFVKTAARVARKKPIIILKTGRSIAGAKAALSHTGSMVGENAVFDAAFEKAGIIRVQNMVEMKAVCQAFLNLPPVQGPKLAVVTATGACGIITADACEDYGLQLAPFPEHVRGSLDSPDIDWFKLGNPADVWPIGMASGRIFEAFSDTAVAFLTDDQTDALLIIVPVFDPPVPSVFDVVKILKETQKGNLKHKPVAMWIYGSGVLNVTKELQEVDNAAIFDTIDEALIGLSAMLRYHQYGQVSICKSVESDTVRSDKTVLPEGVLLGDDVDALLNGHNLPLVPGRLVDNVTSALEFAGEFEYPVVLKVISPDWIHKSDEGGICLNIQGNNELKDAYSQLTNRFTNQVPGGHLTGMLIQKQIVGKELLFGLTRDPQFGAVLVAGMGGIYTEIFQDVSRALVPVSRQEAEAMLKSLKFFPVLQGIRGEKGVALEPLIDAMVSLSRLAEEHPEISEMDLNPVIANENGCWSVDARVIVKASHSISKN